MYDEAGTTTPSSSFDFGGGGGGDGGYDSSVTYQPTTAALGALGPGQVGDSFADTTVNRIKDYLSGKPTLSRGIGGLLGNIIGNFFMPGIGGLLGGYLGQQKAGNYVNQYNLNREAMGDLLGGRLGSPIYSPPPGGINNITTPSFTNPNTIPDLNDPFYSNMLYAQAPGYPTSGYGVRDEEKRNALEQFYQENPDQRPSEQGSLFGGGLTTLV